MMRHLVSGDDSCWGHIVPGRPITPSFHIRALCRQCPDAPGLHLLVPQRPHGELRQRARGARADEGGGGRRADDEPAQPPLRLQGGRG